ncbi:HAMP domain-containing histidine kinase [Aquabacterium sp. A7-Y]|uniref:sensor histidine kinase n=1 Tax=Aquabacterium sp. A7-Y TaxID=1349605 RepID=UPI00223D56A8|nr:HAMP domain-containing sensor histidine kinase [Aquabacterium sp. A7-Y]MCW7539458.1 HAMP domain-containing histidine kinase [Aquabacterium sp. A7-Y]
MRESPQFSPGVRERTARVLFGHRSADESPWALIVAMAAGVLRRATCGNAARTGKSLDLDRQTRAHTKARSLYRRLLYFTLVSFIGVWLLLFLWFLWEVTRVGSGYFDRDLVDLAEGHADLVSLDLSEPERHRMLARRVGQFSRAYAESSLREHEFCYRITDWKGRVLGRSACWPELSRPVLGAAPVSEGLWRTVLVESRDHSVQIQVAVAHSFLQRARTEMLMFFLFPLLALLPILAILLRIGIHHALMPMENLTREIVRHAPQSTSPLKCPDAGYRELAPVQNSVNQLLARIANHRENERRFIADATHELRTPLAAIGAQVHLLVKAESADQRAELAEMLIASIDRSAALVGNLLTLSRLEAESSGHLALKSVDVTQLARDVIARHAPRAIVKNMDLAYEGPDAASVLGDAALLESAMDSMVDNAIVYCPSGATVCLEVRQEPQLIRLAVSDNGVGIPEDMRNGVLKRFVRLPGTVAPGSGLGLSIVKKVAELHEGSVFLTEGLNGRGLRVEVRLPSPG